MNIQALKEKRRKGQAGFTLIELMIVVAIIAILAAVAIPNFLRARYKANFSACVQQLKNISSGLQQEISESGNLDVVNTEDDVCHHILPGNDEAADCPGEVAAMVDENCKSGTYAFTKVDSFSYNIEAQSDEKMLCPICVTEDAVRPVKYDKTLCGAGSDCVHN